MAAFRGLTSLNEVLSKHYEEITQTSLDLALVHAFDDAAPALKLPAKEGIRVSTLRPLTAWQCNNQSINQSVSPKKSLAE